jgi:hypothetical protein
MSRIVVVYPNEYCLTDNKYDIYYVIGRRMEYIDSCFNDVVAGWMAEDMERSYNTEYVTMWVMKKPHVVY